MSDDLVKRLRTEPNWMREDYPQSEAADRIEAQAAEITLLRARIAELEAALQKRCEEAERTAIQAAECHARETRRADALQKRVAKLEEALATARREGMEEAARIAENEPELSGPMPAEFEKYSRETLARASCIATKREIAATIRAALEGGKKDG